MYKFYAPNNHINYRYFHPLNYKNYNLCDKKITSKDAVSHIITKFAVYATKRCK